MPQTVECPRHQGVETALRCGRCETPICPSCLVHSPVGARCPDCAQVMRPPMYTVEGRHRLRALLVTLVAGPVTGVIWWAILLPFTQGFWALLVGVALGYVFTRLLDFVTEGKRGPLLALFAMGGIFAAWIMLVSLTGLQYALWGLIAVGVGVYFSYQNLS